VRSYGDHQSIRFAERLFGHRAHHEPLKAVPSVLSHNHQTHFRLADDRSQFFLVALAHINSCGTPTGASILQCFQQLPTNRIL